MKFCDFFLEIAYLAFFRRALKIQVYKLCFLHPLLPQGLRYGGSPPGDSTEVQKKSRRGFSIDAARRNARSNGLILGHSTDMKKILPWGMALGEGADYDIPRLLTETQSEVAYGQKIIDICYEKALISRENI